MDRGRRTEDDREQSRRSRWAGPDPGSAGTEHERRRPDERSWPVPGDEHGRNAGCVSRTDVGLRAVPDHPGDVDLEELQCPPDGAWVGLLVSGARGRVHLVEERTDAEAVDEPKRLRCPRSTNGLRLRR